MFTYNLTSTPEVAASLYWECHQKTVPSLRLYYDRFYKNLRAMMPNDLNYDKIIYDPTRYLFIGLYDSKSHQKLIEKDIREKMASELYQTPIPGSLRNYDSRNYDGSYEIE